MRLTPYNYTGTYSYMILPDDGSTGGTTPITAPVWSYITVNGKPVLRQGDPMDQNADGTVDENPLTLPKGYTGLTPGDVYAVPEPQPVKPIKFTTALSILQPPFNLNTLPLIVPGRSSREHLGAGW